MNFAKNFCLYKTKGSYRSLAVNKNISLFICCTARSCFDSDSAVPDFYSDSGSCSAGSDSCSAGYSDFDSDCSA